MARSKILRELEAFKRFIKELGSENFVGENLNPEVLNESFGNNAEMYRSLVKLAGIKFTQLNEPIERITGGPRQQASYVSKVTCFAAKDNPIILAQALLEKCKEQGIFSLAEAILRNPHESSLYFNIPAKYFYYYAAGQFFVKELEQSYTDLIGTFKPGFVAEQLALAREILGQNPLTGLEKLINSLRGHDFHTRHNLSEDLYGKLGHVPLNEEDKKALSAEARKTAEFFLDSELTHQRQRLVRRLEKTCSPAEITI